MARIDQTEAFEGCIEALRHGGAFMVAGAEEPNFMTIGWGNPGVVWGKDIFVVYVRLSRYTHDKLEEIPEFTVCVPKKGELMKARGFAGSKSGREVDKAKELGFTYEPSCEISVPRLSGCEYAYECKVVYKTEMHEAMLDKEIQERHYATGDYHTIYFGEIVAVHKF